MEKILGLVVLFLIIVGGMFAWEVTTASTRQANANELARRWVSEVFTPEEARTARVVCQATDSDDNGYVSCTLNITRGGEEQLIPIECHSYVVINLGDTCRQVVPYGTATGGSRQR